MVALSSALPPLSRRMLCWRRLPCRRRLLLSPLPRLHLRGFRHHRRVPTELVVFARTTPTTTPRPDHRLGSSAPLGLLHRTPLSLYFPCGGGPLPLQPLLLLTHPRRGLVVSAYDCF